MEGRLRRGGSLLQQPSGFGWGQVSYLFAFKVGIVLKFLFLSFFNLFKADVEVFSMGGCSNPRVGT